MLCIRFPDLRVGFWNCYQICGYYLLAVEMYFSNVQEGKG